MGGMHARVTGVPKGVAVAMAMGRGHAPGPGVPAGGGDSGGSGVRGVLIVDQGGPVVREDRPWPTYPLHGRVEAMRADPAGTGPLAWADSDEQGRFMLPLPPGDYVLHARNLTGAPVPFAWPVPVQVTAGAFIEVTIHFDSGIR